MGRLLLSSEAWLLRVGPAFKTAGGVGSPKTRVTETPVNARHGRARLLGEEKSRFASGKSETPGLTRFFPHFSQL